jgi:hypothetical protein
MEKGVDSGIGVLVPVGQKLPNLQKEIDEAVAVKSDGFKAADSVAQLAKELSVPEANLQKAVDQYNKACEVGYDGILQRKSLSPSTEYEETLRHQTQSLLLQFLRRFKHQPQASGSGQEQKTD